MSGEILMGALAPHPPIVVPEVGGAEVAKVATTQKALRRLSRRVAEVRPDVLVMFSPHAPLLPDAIPVLSPPVLGGSLEGFGAPQVGAEFRVDGELADAMVREADKLGVAAVQVGGESPFRPLTLDHGLLVPLYYLSEAGVRCQLVATGIALLDREPLRQFGRAVAAAVRGLGRRVVVVASGDLSHRLLPGAPAGFHPQARRFDELVVQNLRNEDVQAVRQLDETLVENAGECGFRPLLMLLGALEESGLRPDVLSYEGPFGVGYAVVMWERGGRSWPVRLAMASLEAYLREGRVMPPPLPAEVPAGFGRRAGAFVSLKKAGELRGCIGTIEPTRMSLAEEIIYNAISAGTRDPRFPPVQPDEFEQLDCSVDVLEEPELVEGYGELDPRRYGVIVRKGYRTGLLLPDLEGVDTVEQQVAIARQKAGIRPEERDVELYRFRVTRYH